MTREYAAGSGMSGGASSSVPLVSAKQNTPQLGAGAALRGAFDVNRHTSATRTITRPSVFISRHSIGTRRSEPCADPAPGRERERQQREERRERTREPHRRADTRTAQPLRNRHQRADREPRDEPARVRSVVRAEVREARDETLREQEQRACGERA